MIDHRRKLLFIHIARTGGTSIEESLVQEDWWKIDPATKHLSASQARRRYGEEVWRGYTTFAIVRNPWDRFVSMWTAGFWYDQETSLQGVRPASFKDFIHTLRPHPHEIYNTLHQYRILDEKIDFILRFENLQQDFSEMLKKQDLDDVVLHVSSKSERGPYRDYYDEELADWIAHTYATDVERYRYSFWLELCDARELVSEGGLRAQNGSRACQFCTSPCRDGTVPRPG